MEFLFAEIRLGNVEGLKLTEVLLDIAKADWYGGPSYEQRRRAKGIRADVTSKSNGESGSEKQCRQRRNAIAV
jgi:hypothetical protein